jgi:hypothetical protein
MPLKGYNYLRRNIQNANASGLIYIKLLEHSKFVIENYIKSSNKLLAELEVKHEIQKTQRGRQMFFGKGYIMKGEAGFEMAKAKRGKLLYRAVVYKLKCKILDFKDMLYIGWARDEGRRLMIHVEDSINPYGQGCKFKTLVPLHQAIRATMQWNFNLIQDEIELTHPDLIRNDTIQSIEDLYNWLINQKGQWIYYKMLNMIVECIIKENFDVDVIELHKEVETALDREKYYTLNFINYIDGNKVIGTINPNGLNDRVGGSGGEVFIRLPLLDIAAMLSLGLKIPKITEIIVQEYNKKVSTWTVRNRIREIWKTIDDARRLFLKPVIDKFIEDDSNFEYTDILKVIQLNDKTLRNYLKTWHDGKSFRNLKRFLRTYTSTEIRGRSLNQWKTWATEGAKQEDIANEIGVSTKTIERTYKEISHLLIGKHSFNFRQTQKILRQINAVKLLSQGWHPKKIFRDAFKFHSLDNYRRDLEVVFNNKMSYNQIIKLHYNVPKDFLGD